MEKIIIIKKILNYFENNNISYCVLRNYNFMLEERLPLTASEKSIDLFIATKDFPEADRILERYGFKKRNSEIKNFIDFSQDVNACIIHFCSFSFLLPSINLIF